MKPYTVEADPRGEARVASDLDHITAAVRREAEGDDLAAVLLLGGYARGEGTVVASGDGSLRGFNDYDLLLVFDRPPRDPERYPALSRKLARALEIDFVDLGLVAIDVLPRVPATLFWYELGEAHRILWQRPGASVPLRRFGARDLEEEESTRLLLNRGMGLVWAGLRLWPEETPGRGRTAGDPETLRFAAVAAEKAILAAGDAALLRAGRYVPSLAARERRLREDPELTGWCAKGFLDAYARGVAFRREPRIGSEDEVARRWEEARRHHEAGYRASESERLGRRFDGWEEHSRLVAGRARVERLRAPRSAARALFRRFTGREWRSLEERLIGELPVLLYLPPDPARWRRRAGEAVEEWHP